MGVVVFVQDVFMLFGLAQEIILVSKCEHHVWGSWKQNLCCLISRIAFVSYWYDTVQKVVVLLILFSLDVQSGGIICSFSTIGYAEPKKSEPR